MDPVGQRSLTGAGMTLTRRLFLIGSAGSGGAVALAAAIQPGGKLLGPARQAPSQPTRTLAVSQFGARGDGVSDDRPAIQAAIDTLARSGGGTLSFGAGTFMVSRTQPTAVALTLRSGVTLQGQGQTTIIKLMDGAGGHTINVVRESNCAVRNLVIDGNRARQSSTGHGFRSGGVTGLTLANVVIRNTFQYGIGLEGGTNRNVSIDGVTIHDVGGDGIDIKNRNNDDFNIVLTNITVRRWGLRTDRQTQAGIDCRSSVRLANIDVAEPGSDDSVGIRMRQGEVGTINGLGGHHSNLDGFQVRMGPGEAQTGINVVARSVSVSNGSIAGGARGLLVQGSDFRGSQLSISGCAHSGIIVDANGRGFDGDRATLSGCTVENCGENGIEVDADQVQILNCSSRGSGGYGLLVKQTASATRVVGGDFRGNRAGQIANLGAS